MPPLLLEVIVLTIEDAKAAAAGGADRLEVVRNIETGGLTPPLSLVRAIAEETGLPLRVMLRENGGYGTDAAEIAAMRRAAGEFAAARVDGLVTGFARDGEPLLEPTAQVLEAASGIRATFHRAFDQLRDQPSAIDRLATLSQIDRILTDGGPGTPEARSRRLASLAARAAGRLTIIAGGGVDADAIACFARTGAVREVHVGRAARVAGRQDAPVSVESVRRLRELCSAHCSFKW
jgi:copper homeostasis protein